MAQTEPKAHQVTFANQNTDREVRFADSKPGGAPAPDASFKSVRRSASIGRNVKDGTRNSLDSLVPQSLPPALEPELGTASERPEVPVDETPKAGMSNGLKKLRNTLRFSMHIVFLCCDLKPDDLSHPPKLS